MEHRPAVMAVIVNDENKFLIGSSPRDGGHKFPQGGIDEGETPIEALKRELMEEIGIDLHDEDILKECGKVIYNYKPGFLKDGKYISQENRVFLVKYREDMNPIPQDDEFDKLFWINASEIEDYAVDRKVEAYKEALRLCGLI